MSLKIKNTFFRQSSDGDELDLVHHRSTPIEYKSHTISCSPTMIQDSSLVHDLTYEQIKFLNCGPTYVPQCQIHILSKISLTLAEIVTKQMAPLRRGLTKLFTKYPVDLSRRMSFEKEIQQFFNESFVQTISAMIEERVIYEKKLLQSIQYQLKRNRLMLRRTAANNNTYYLGQIDEF